jgi:type I restriction enzyme S subunit
MPLKQFTIDFQELGKDQYLRNDEKYHVFLNFSNWNLFDVKNKNLISLKDILIDDYHNFEYEEGEEYKGIPTGQTYLDEDGYIKEFQPVTAEDHPGRLKYKASNDNILISSLRLAKSPALYFESEDLLDYVFSNGFYIYKVKEGWNKKFILYVLRTKRLKDVLDNHIYRGIGISAYKNEDLKKIKIPLIPKSTQNQIVAQIEPIEKKIKELKAQITPPKEIINKVFAREVGFDLEKLGELKKEKFFEVNFPKISNYHSLRFDVKNQKYLDVFNDIIKDFGSSFFLKSISKDKGKYGANEPAKDGEKGIDTRYIRITDVDSVGNLSDDDWKTAENIAEEYLLKDDDFLFARSGNTVGKTFLYDSNKHEEAIFAGYFIKFNLDFTNLDKLFFLYYTKSFIYNFWIRGIVRIKGQPNINANEYLELKIPNITLKDQQKIVDEIKIELDKQEEINKKIQTERNKIDEIIEKAIV